MRRIRSGGSTIDVDLHDQVGWHAFFGFSIAAEEHLHALFAPGQVVADVGANIGTTALFEASAVGPNGRVFAFEPHPGNFSKMKHNLSLNAASNVSPVNMGLSDVAGPAFMDEPRSDNAGAHRVSPTGRVPIQLTTLDRFLDSVGPLERLDVVKIDVEGFETRVLRGAKRTLARFHPVLFIEVHDGHLRDAGSSAKELITFVRGLGYEVVDADTGAQTYPDSDFTEWTDVICKTIAGQRTVA